MYTISQRAKTVKQPRGGYLSPKEFHMNEFTELERKAPGLAMGSSQGMILSSK